MIKDYLLLLHRSFIVRNKGRKPYKFTPYMKKAIIEIVKNYKFSIIIEEDAHGFFVSCPAIQGCYSQGKTYDEAILNIKDAIRLHLADRHENAEKLPKAKSLSVATVEVTV